MADSRRIIPPTGGNAADNTGQSEQAGLPRIISAASLRIRTDRIVVDGTTTSPAAIVGQSSRRRSASVYYPATDPLTLAANTSTIFVCGTPSDAERAFPLEPGGALSVETAGWLYGFTTDGATPTVFVLAEED